MDLNVPAAKRAAGQRLSRHDEGERVVPARLAIVYHRHAEGARLTVLDAGTGESRRIAGDGQGGDGNAADLL